jgi:hypothetical protein
VIGVIPGEAPKGAKSQNDNLIGMMARVGTPMVTLVR